MSQSQGVSEAELIESIQKLINLKLDKEALIRPNRNVVCEIYSRFLDQIRPNWRESKTGGDPQESSQFIQLLTWMRLLLGRYGPDLDYEFDGNDLITPNRKRTHVFLQALVLFKVDLGMKKMNKQFKMAALAEEREKIELMDRELASLRLERDNLAHKIGDAPSLPEFSRNAEAMKLKLDEHKKLCEDHDEQVKDFKKKMAASQEEMLRLQEEEEKFKMKEAERQKYSKVLELREKKAKYEGNLETLKLQMAVTQKQAQTNLQKEREKVRDRKQSRSDKLTSRKEDLEELRRKNLEIPIKRKENEDKIKIAIERSNKQLEPLRNRAEATMRKSESARATMDSLQFKIDALIGTTKVENNGNSVKKAENNGNSVNNATYIKSHQ